MAFIFYPNLYYVNLESFVHKADISWWLFAIALLLTGAISLLTLIWQIRKAARTNPAEVIKSE
ncbi:hypothetical protein [Parabacteroides johnsonii]|uniref:hypothetical protein n=1 Tax=Parabacteroides johnsonii TaxID=387661 RepID=UPI00241C4D2D|nr:hypothetical protein [Parabacteroides johnsonii]